jgi:uncharacterized protein YndB with AHSA1/START domain
MIEVTSPTLAEAEEAEMTPTIEQEILIEAPVVVWRAVTEPEQITRWFADEVDLVLEPGYQGSLRFTEQATDGPVTVEVTVQSVQPARSFAYRWIHSDGAEAAAGNSTLVEFTLVPEGDGTRLRVVETGVEQMGWSQERQDEFTDDHTEGWARHFGRLRDVFSEQRAR